MQWKATDKTEWRPWFAWFPVKAEDGSWAWLESVQRRWNAQLYFTFIHPDDPGDYCGGWEYRVLAPALAAPPAGDK